MDKLGVGMIGCGGISRLHAESWQKVSCADIIACADVDEAKAQEFKQKFGVPDAVTDYRRLLEREDVDAVDICIPTFLHAEVAVAAAQAGKHVLCEKPIAMTLADADRMIDAARDAGVKFMIAFPRRFSVEQAATRKIILDNEIGRPVLWRQVSADSGPPSPWYLDIDKGGGPFIDGLVHTYDFARFTFGEPKWAWASLRTMKCDSTALDTGVCLVEFESGDQLMVSASWGLPGQTHGDCRGESMRDVLGPQGVIASAPAPSSPDEKPHLLVRSGKPQVRKVEYEPQQVADMFRLEIAHFAECVLEDKPPCVTGHDGKRAVEIALAVFESSLTGARVSL